MMVDYDSPAGAFVIILGFLGAWISYKTGISKLEAIDQLAFAALFAGLVIFLIIFVKRRFG